jgi:hypothetical protein
MNLQSAISTSFSPRAATVDVAALLRISLLLLRR